MEIPTTDELGLEAFEAAEGALRTGAYRLQFGESLTSPDPSAPVLDHNAGGRYRSFSVAAGPKLVRSVTVIWSGGAELKVTLQEQAPKYGEANRRYEALVPVSLHPWAGPRSVGTLIGMAVAVLLLPEQPVPFDQWAVAVSQLERAVDSLNNPRKS
ncbi:MAG TPA: hypothetical protein VN635_15650 [Conexibacter sp.]|nr:hypothetical protein [Conexibacter sp.]